MSFDWSPYVGSEESEFPPTFKFENKGDKIAGEILGIREWENDGTKTPILEIDGESGSSSVFVSQVLLKQQVAALNPQVGDAIAIQFVGHQKTKRGNTMKDFEVMVTRAGNTDPDEEPF